ncbi:hypothetical protein F3J24_04695 [Comamonas sp. Tr-654]|uniref:hypothetical protein n=1 Tax=Comamonas sp. Tr-654 TaxID=2608341 RepID=UPI00141E8999|nr:hypothetical protein [Comamonas sp. Tr-654]NIF82805.1 hypothetical protein [Comamonas sp. Tr-654]
MSKALGFGDHKTTSASTVGLPEDKAYIAHHFTCCAAGLSGGKQARCGDGQQLWDAYNQAVTDSQPQNNRKTRAELNSVRGT